MRYYQDYEPLRLALLQFSKYKKFDEEKEGISCPIAIQKFQKEKNKEGADKKSIIVFIISNGKIIKTVKNTLDKFNIAFFNRYMYDKKTLQAVAYLFDTKKDNKVFKQFLYTLSISDSVFKKAKEFILEYKYIYPFVGIIFSALVLYFVYLGINAYGIVPQKLVGIQEIYFLMLFIFLSIVVVVFFIYLLAPIVLLLLFIFGMIGYFAMEISLLNITVSSLFIGILLLGILYFFSKLKPLLVDTFLNEGKMFIPTLAAASGAVLLMLIFAIIGAPSISGVVTHDFSKHLWKSNYRMVRDVYQNIYSGYPKILINHAENDKIYYIPFESAGNYYVYDIAKVKERYFDDIAKIKDLRKLCKNKNLQDTLIETYIIDNPYIKPKYQTKHFSINDKNITLQEFNSSKIITYDDFDSNLCKGRDR